MRGVKPRYSAGMSRRYVPSRPDVLAGLSIAGLLIPEAVAYATIANLTPQAGIMALLSGLVCYGLLGSSRFAVVSATSSSAAVLAATTLSMSGGQMGNRVALAAGLVLLTGLFFWLASLARMGRISAFVSKPVLQGFAFGLSLIIMLRQLPHVMGVSPTHTDMLHFVPELIQLAPQWNLQGLLLGAIALSLLFLLKPLKQVPGALVVIALGMLLAHLVDLPGRGIDLVGPIGFSWVWPSLPTISQDQWLRLAELAFAMVLILYAESYGSIRNFALRHGDAIKPNQDLMALGTANVVSGLLQGLPVGAGYSATAANEAAGARSKWASWVAGAVVLLIVSLLLNDLAWLPRPVLSAIVIHAVSHSLNPEVFRPYFKLHRDRKVVIGTIVGVIVLGVLDGLLAAIGISLLVTLSRLTNAQVSELGRLGDGHDFVGIRLHPDAKSENGILILRPETPLFFANVEHVLHDVRQMVRHTPGLHTLILSLEECPDLDGTSVEALRDLARDMDKRGLRLILTRLKAPTHTVLQRAEIAALPDTRLSELSVDGAVSLARSLQAQTAAPASAQTDQG